MTNQSGQAVLIVLLTMIVSLTIVLSVIASSTSDIKIGTNEANSSRAFSAAESGIDKALITNANSSGSLGNSSFHANVASLSQGATSFVYPANLANGEDATFWFVSHATNGNLACDGSNPCFTGKTLKICWGLPGTSSSLATTPAVELTVFYLDTPGNYSTTKLVKALFDPNSGRLAANSYLGTDAGTCTIGTKQFAFQKQIDLSSLGVSINSYNSVNGLQFLIAKMIYNTGVPSSIGMDVNFAGNTPLPGQGSLVHSTGTLNGASRKIEVTKVYNQMPPVFDAAVYSPGGLLQ